MRPPASGHRDIASVEDAAAASVTSGQAYVTVIGVNDYRVWPPLRNAVQDAEGAMEAFAALGFEAGRFVLLQDGEAADLERTPSLLRTEQLSEDELMELAARDRPRQ